jgi:hypothetical protein
VTVVVHRPRWAATLKPAASFRCPRGPQLENILLRREADGERHAKLSDFGLAVALDDKGQRVRCLV